MKSAMVAIVLAALGIGVLAQGQGAAGFHPVEGLQWDQQGPVIRAHAEAGKPFTVAGERGVVLGQQDGTFEAWVLPVKLLSHMTLEADVEGYGVPVPLNPEAAEIEVRADRTVITYAHPAFTVRQIMFSPAGAPGGTGLAQTGPVVLYQFDCLHPTEFTFRFTPELKWMWPERNEGVPGADWVGPEGGGFYALHTDYPDLGAAITIPGARPGIMAPYQERPREHPLELKLHIDPARDGGKLFPLLMTAGMTVKTATNAAMGATLAELNARVSALYAAHAEEYRNLRTESTSIETPDRALNEAFEWGVVSIEQLRTQLVVPGQEGKAERALVAGYLSSADSTRPGFGWYFGRDALYTVYAVDGYGDFGLTKDELEFLIRRQRADGKIMHEYSQTAPEVDWRAFPYMYVAADATPLFLLAVADYARASGDGEFVKAHREAIEKAWSFETDPAHDTDHDGIYDNSQGTGWVESWPGGMPHQEIYLALLDQEASAAMGMLEDLVGDGGKAAAARARAEKVAKTINAEYYDADKKCYAFSRNVDGTLDRTRTVYPAMAWWDPAGGKSLLEHGGECLEEFAGAGLNTDWGLRDVAEDEKIYDGLSYHQGSVWPLFTGWAAMAEYRGGQPLAGYQLLMENANLTWAQDPGSDTELLSGDFFVPFARSTSHQLWSSAMVVTPALRGLFGIDVDAGAKTVTVNPHLPPSWNHAEIHRLRVGEARVDVSFTRDAGVLTVKLTGADAAGLKVLSTEPGARSAGKDELRIPQRAVEIEPFFVAPRPGDRTLAMRVIEEKDEDRKLTLTVEGVGGSDGKLSVMHAANVHVKADGGTLNESGTELGIHFPAGAGWRKAPVILTW